MSATVDVLLIADSEQVTSLISQNLSHSGYKPIIERVSNAEAIRAAVAQKDYDIIVSEYRLRDFTGLDVLTLINDRNITIPCIVLADTFQGEQATAAYRAGALDYVTRDTLASLPFVVKRELRAAEYHQKYIKAQAALEKYLQRESQLEQEHEHRLLAETLSEISLTLTSQTSLEAVLNEILRQMKRLISYKTAHIMLLKGTELQIGAWQGYEAFNSEKTISELSQSLADFPLDVEAVQKRQPILVSDTSQEARWIVNSETRWVRSHLSIPICLSDRVLGLLRLDSDTPNAFSAQDSAQLQPLTNAAAIALQNALLHEQARQEIVDRKRAEQTLRQRNQQLELLNNASQTFISTLDLDQVLATVLESVRDQMQVAAWSVWLVDPETGELVCHQATDPKMEHIRGWRLAPGEGIVGWVAQTGESVIISDTRTDERHYKAVDHQIGEEARAILSVPLKIKDRAIGALQVVDVRPNRFKASDQKLLEPLAANAAIAIENARLYQEVQDELVERKRAEEELRHRNRDLLLLNQVIAASTASLDPEAILAATCKELTVAFDVSQTVAILLHEIQVEAEVVAEYSVQTQSSILHKRFSVDNYPSFKHLLDRKLPVIIDDAQTGDPALSSFREILDQDNIRLVVVIPLVIKEAVVGCLILNSIELRSFSSAEGTLVKRVAEQVAGALSRATLTQTSQRLTAAIEQSPDGVIITDPAGKILYANPAFEQVTGYSQAEAIDQKPNLVKSDKHNPGFYEKLWSTILAGKVWHGRIINKRKDGTLYTADTIIGPVRNENNEIVNYVSISRDITRELELEEKYQQAQKMQAIGLLAGGVAHDFSNMLTAINGFAEMIQLEISPDQSKLYDLASKIRYSGKRATALVRQLLVFSRKHFAEPEVLDLNKIVENTSKLLERLIEENIELETHLAADLWRVKVDPSQIEQVIVNLAVNARDAMPDGGRLIIKTKNEWLKDGLSTRNISLESGKYVLLAVTDTGVGMSEEVQERIFEPFFTTKEEGKGTGLGLATVFGIVKHSGGQIDVSSEPGRGSTFQVYLPRTKATAPAKSPVSEPRKVAQGIETILLVEDEPAVRELTTYVLRRQGYTVLQATNGLEALRLTQEHKGEIHLLMTDSVMPKMSGQALIKKFKVQRPDTKILLTSGYTDKPVNNGGNDSGTIEFIQKPFSAVELTRKVRAMLDS